MSNGLRTSNHQSKAWCFTLNNPTEEETKSIHALESKQARIAQGIQFAIYGEETGESGTRHYQGYIEFTKRIRISGCRKFLSRAHFESRKGTPLQGVFRIIQ